MAKPLVKYVDKALVEAIPLQAAKVTLLVGNTIPILPSLRTALDFEPYQLHDQYERTPDRREDRTFSSAGMIASA